MKITTIVPFLMLGLFAACSALKLQPADFAWPVESVLTVDENGKVNETRYSISFDTRGLFYEEFKDSSLFKDKEIRMIRDSNGFYFITAEKFKNVYVFKIDNGAMVLDNEIFISDSGVESPALNQRFPHIELISTGKSIYLKNTGIDRDKK
jgi:hypothetical protein